MAVEFSATPCVKTMMNDGKPYFILLFIRKPYERETVMRHDFVGFIPASTGCNLRAAFALQNCHFLNATTSGKSFLPTDICTNYVLPPQLPEAALVLPSGQF